MSEGGREGGGGRERGGGRQAAGGPPPHATPGEAHHHRRHSTASCTQAAAAGKQQKQPNATKTHLSWRAMHACTPHGSHDIGRDFRDPSQPASSLAAVGQAGGQAVGRAGRESPGASPSAACPPLPLSTRALRQEALGALSRCPPAIYVQLNPQGGRGQCA